MMEHFLEVFRGAELICIPSSSCVAMIRDHYPKMAAASGDAALRRSVKNTLPRIFEFTELLVDKLGVTDVGAFFPHTVALHPSCHSLRSLKLGDRPAQLLKGVRGLTLLDLPEAEECCGFGGHVRGEECGCVGGDVIGQSALFAQYASGDLRGGRQFVPHAHRWRVEPAEGRYAGNASGGNFGGA